MKLSIHIISHPIIQYLSSITEQKNLMSSTKHQWFRQLGLLLIYETIRNWLKTYQVSIKKVSYTTDMTITDPKESYVIIADTGINLSLIQEVQYLLPQCHINLISSSSYGSRKEHELNSCAKHLDKNTKIIIISSEIDIDYILGTIHTLIYIQGISIEQIRLTCIKCETEKLIKISQEYPMLNIFTASIKKQSTRTLYNT